MFLFKRFRYSTLIPLYREGENGAGAGAGGAVGDGAGTGSGQGTGDGSGSGTGDGSGDGAGSGAGGTQSVTMTQAELDQLITDRLNRDRIAREKAAKEQKERDALSAEERHKAELADRDKALKARDLAIVSSRAEVMATAAGVRPERMKYFLSLCQSELAASVEVQADGTFDTKAVQSVVSQVLKDVPELAGEQPGQKGGNQMGGGSSAAGGDEPITDDWLLKASTEDMMKREADIKAYMEKRH